MSYGLCKMSEQNAWLLARHINSFKGQVRLWHVSKHHINMATDLKMRGVTMKKREFVLEKQGAQDLHPKRKHETKVVNKKARKL